MEWYEKFLAEAHVIIAAPRAFAVVFGVAILVIWGVFAFLYSGRIDGYKDALTSKDSLLADYKDKLNGATPAEAKKRLEALELQVAALSPRRVTEEQKQALTRAAHAASGSVIEVASDMAVADAKPFTKDIALAFQAAGWTVRLPMVGGIGNPPASGVALIVRDPQHLNEPEAVAKSALEAAHIAYDLQPGLRVELGDARPDYPQAQAQILVTSR